MKATFEYDLAVKDDRYDYEAASQAVQLKLAMWDFSQEVLRKLRKYGHDDFKDKDELLSHIEKRFYECLEGRKASIE